MENGEAPKGVRQAADADLVYRMERWPRYLFGREAGHGGQLSKTMQLRDDPQWPGFTREVFGRLYGLGTSKMDEPRPGAEWAAELHTQADAVPEWKGLEGRLHGNAWRAGMVTATVATVLNEKLPEKLPEEDLKSLLGEADVMDEIMNAGDGNKPQATKRMLRQRAKLQKRIIDAEAQAKEALDHVQNGAGHVMRSALRAAAAQANAMLDDIDEGMAVLGYGPGSQVAPAEKQRIASQLATDAQLRQIVKIAGRLRAQAIRKQRTKVNNLPEEVHGITKGDDLQHLLSSEVGLLSTPATQPLLMQRIIERRALQYELRGRETKTRGPIIFCIDTSGSMQGLRDAWAKACALAMMEIARRQKRSFAIVFFNGGVAKVKHFPDPGKIQFADLLDALSFFSGGGTNISVAMRYACNVIETGLVHEARWKNGKDADIVVVSDGDDTSNVTGLIQKAHALEASVYAVFIQRPPCGALAMDADDCVHISDAELRGANSKLDKVFSI